MDVVFSAAQVVIENASPAFDREYTYRIPADMEDTAVPGCRVQVPFGRSNRGRTGLILQRTQCTVPQEDADKYKPVRKLLDQTPILDHEGMTLLRYLKEFTFCTWFDGVKTLIPTGLGMQQEIVYTLRNPVQRSVTPEEKRILTFVNTRRGPAKHPALAKALELSPQELKTYPPLLTLLEEEILEKGEEIRQRIQDDRVTLVRPIQDQRQARLTDRQAEVLEFIEENPDISVREIIYYAGTSASVIHALERKGWVELYEVTRFRGGFDEATPDDSPPPTLSEDQSQAYQALLSHYQKSDSSPALLYGVTGSGKTEVFLKLIEHVIQQEQGVIVMVPEISLTSQTIRSLQGRFGNLVAVLHSGLSLGERMDEWRRIQEGKAQIVVGTRSAVFAPLPTIGLIVMDEEQEHTYKSDRAPRYHARDIARLRCRYHGGMLLLSSATPAVETYYYASTGRYLLVTLPQRYGKSQPPTVEIVDMREPKNLSRSLSLSSLLLEELSATLAAGEQSILLLNRRGYSTVVTCSSCGQAAECPHCSVALTYHAANDHLICHYCGYSESRRTACRHCGSELIRYSGIGTQKLEEELHGWFPNANILRMDTDTTMARHSHEEMFDAFRKGKYDIMIGTQMVAKGLNFPKVTLVGVLNADQALYTNDFRSYERSFSLITQVVGRSGRSHIPGKALIQSWSPEHFIINYAVQQDYPAFYQDEILARELSLYPPFCTLAGFGFVGESLEETRRMADVFAREFSRVAQQEYPDAPLRVLGPSPGEVLKIAGKYRYKLVIKCRNDKKTRNFFSHMLQWFYGQSRDVSLFIDMYYEQM